MNQIQPAPERLTLTQHFRLVEIAHETKDPDVRKLALELLDTVLHPPMFVGLDSDKKPE